MNQEYIDACEKRRRSVENAMAIMLTATSGPDDLFMKVIEDYIYGKISLEEMERKIDNSILI